MELDYPRKPENAAKLSDETKAQNKELQEKYAIEGFPTILLCDADGKPFAKTGYKPGGPEKYVAILDELRARKEIRDKSFAEAAKSEGPAKAKALVAALDAMELDDAAVASFYPDLIDQIKAADPKDEIGYGKKLAEKAKFAKFGTELNGFAAKQDMEGALAFVEKSVASGEFEAESKQQMRPKLPRRKARSQARWTASRPSLRKPKPRRARRVRKSLRKSPKSKFPRRFCFQRRPVMPDGVFDFNHSPCLDAAPSLARCSACDERHYPPFFQSAS